MNYVLLVLRSPRPDLAAAPTGGSETAVAVVGPYYSKEEARADRSAVVGRIAGGSVGRAADPDYHYRAVAWSLDEPTGAVETVLGDALSVVRWPEKDGIVELDFTIDGRDYSISVNPDAVGESTELTPYDEYCLDDLNSIEVASLPKHHRDPVVATIASVAR